MRLFISQPAENKSFESLCTERNRVVNLMQALHPNEEIDFMVNYITDPSPRASNRAVYRLSEFIRLMSLADMIYFARGWQDDYSCRIEHEVAVAYNLTFFEE